MVGKKRAQFCKFWTQRCSELEEEERVFHENMEPQLRLVLQGKRLLLFKEMLEAYDYPDKTLVDDIAKGFPLSGWLSKSRVFPVGLKRPPQSVDSALKVSKGINKGICKQVVANTDHDLSNEGWGQTLDELSNRWT